MKQNDSTESVAIYFYKFTMEIATRCKHIAELCLPYVYVVFAQCLLIYASFVALFCSVLKVDKTDGWEIRGILKSAG